MTTYNDYIKGLEDKLRAYFDTPSNLCINKKYEAVLAYMSNSKFTGSGRLYEDQTYSYQGSKTCFFIREIWKDGQGKSHRALISDGLSPARALMAAVLHYHCHIDFNQLAGRHTSKLIKGER